ncbi:protein kinase [Enhygromyxa salina]|uniref:Protein kinase n=1 Tax=Enhygromyxa salina TaxID=215803 RepID=A0A0C1ZNN8_9BACT|nr:protein kinase [Enhygromyxa salina]KIG19089.1 protein kinase [Enhygromyxa salina]
MAQLIDLGGGPVNQSEREIFEILVRDLPGSWAVAPNVNLPHPRTGHAYEYDAIVIGPHAVYVVEIKGWRRQIRQLNREEWQLSGGQVVRNPLSLTDQKARVLASEIKRHRWASAGAPYVQACLVVGSDRASFAVNDADAGRCLRPSELVAYLRDPQRLSTDRAPGDYRRDLKRLGDLIRGQFEGKPESPRRYGSYLAADLQERDQESAVWLGRHALLDDARIYRIRAWYLSEYRYTPEQRTERIRVLRRNTDALHKVGEHPCIAQLRDFGEREGEFYEVTDWTVQGTLKTARDRGVLDKLPVSEKLSILRDVARGLEAAAAHDIVHRALSPAAVLLTADGHARLCGFDRAWLLESAGTVYGAAPQISRTYLPPELRDASDYEVFDNSDLYSLGKVGQFLFGECVPPEVAELLDLCLRDDPGERPDNPAAFLHELELAIRPPEPEPTPDPEPELEAELEPAKALPTSGRPQLEPGDIIEGVNMVLSELGRSATSTVYRVDNEPLGEVFALKLVHAPAAGYDPMEEFRLLRKLDCPHVPRAHWCGRTSLGAGPDLSYLLLDYIEGPGLRQVIDDGPVEVETALDLIDDLLAALEALHGSGGDSLHRDLKPENVIVGPEGAVLLDFGLARPTTDAGATPDGTLRYTPPDLSESGWDASADLFALGCIAYELLAGTSPWDGLTTTQAPASLETLRGEVTERVSSVFARSLAARSSERYSDASTMRAALREARSSPSLPEPSALTEDSGANAAQSLEPDEEFGVLATDVDLWTAARVQAISEHAHLQIPLAKALLDCIVEPVDESPESLLSALLASEARAKALELPLAEALGSCYSMLASEQLPLELGDDAGDSDEDDPAPRVVELDAEDRILRVDGLHFTELRYVERLALQLDRTTTAWVWCAGATDPAVVAETDAAFARALSGGAGAACVSLPRGARDELDLPATLRARRNALQEHLRGALEQPGALWVLSCWGTVYLGHGLRTDPGEGLGERAAAIRDRWAAAFPGARVAPDAGDAPPRDSLHVRVGGGRRFAVGRLAWPDPPRTPWLQAGGLSLPERLLILLRISRGTP